MKPDNSGGGKMEIIAFFVSVITISVLVLTIGSSELSYAAASVVFYAGQTENTETVSRRQEASAETVTEQITEAAKHSDDITETPSDIRILVEKYKKLLRTTPIATAEDTAKVAGIDLTDKEFWRAALQTIADRIDQFCELVEK